MTTLTLVLALAAAAILGQLQEQDGIQKDEPMLPEFVVLGPGEVVMGHGQLDPQDHDYFPDETPLRVEVDRFHMAKTVVTAEAFCKFLNAVAGHDAHDTDLYYKLDPDQAGYPKWSSIEKVEGQFVPRANAAQAPANRVTWLGAAKYCEWLSERTGETYRLPTEAEWEFATRGEEGRMWPWGKDDPKADAQVVRGARWQGKEWDGRPWPQYAVGDSPDGATPDGVFGLMGDAHGEWCVNIYVPNPTPEQADDEAAHMEDLESPRVIRGGYHRLGRSTPFGRWLRTNNWRDGRVWTRIHQPPLGEGGNSDSPPLAAVRLVREPE